MTYDDWKLASPKEYEEDAPPAQPQPGNEDRCECGDYPLEDCPSSHSCFADDDLEEKHDESL